MDNDFYLKVLEKAANNGVFISTDISDEIRLYFDRYHDPIAEDWTGLKKSVEDVLKKISYDGLIEYKNETPEVNFAGNNDYRDKIKASITIQPKGLLFFYEKKKVDTASKANNMTMWFIIITATIGILNFIGTILLLFKK